MASNGNLSADSLVRRMGKFPNSWESSLDTKLSDFNSRLTSVFNSHVFPDNNVSVEYAEKIYIPRQG